MFDWAREPSTGAGYAGGGDEGNRFQFREATFLPAEHGSPVMSISQWTETDVGSKFPRFAVHARGTITDATAVLSPGKWVLLADALTRFSPSDAPSFPGCGDVQAFEMRGGIAKVVAHEANGMALRRKTLLDTMFNTCIPSATEKKPPPNLPSSDPGPIGSTSAQTTRGAGGRPAGSRTVTELRLTLTDEESELLSAITEAKKAEHDVERYLNGWTVRWQVWTKQKGQHIGERSTLLTVTTPHGKRLNSIIKVPMLGLQPRLEGRSWGLLPSPLSSLISLTSVPCVRAPSWKVKEELGLVRVEESSPDATGKRAAPAGGKKAKKAKKRGNSFDSDGSEEEGDIEDENDDVVEIDDGDDDDAVDEAGATSMATGYGAYSRPYVDEMGHEMRDERDDLPTSLEELHRSGLLGALPLPPSTQPAARAGDDGGSELDSQWVEELD